MLYSEIFRSIQGEGVYTGVPTVWLRMFGCNLECNGFGQKDPTDPDSYVLPYQEIDLTDITVPEELPVFSYGCDSSYSWSKKFKKLQRKGTPEEVSKQLFDLSAANIFACSSGVKFFQILKLLGLNSGIIVINKVDLVDKEWIDLVELEIKEFVKDTFLHKAKIIKVSTILNTPGIDS